MFKSKVYTYKRIFDMIKNEVESCATVPDDVLLLACNSELQYLYSQVIKKQVLKTGYVSDSSAGDIEVVLKTEILDAPIEVQFDDIVLVRNKNGENFMPTLPKNAGAYSNTYFEDENGNLNVIMDKDYDGEIEVFYIYRPDEVDSVTSTEYVELPTEYIPMLLGAIRTEAYKYINEDAMSAKWANDRNSYLEGFVKWIELTRPQFG